MADINSTLNQSTEAVTTGVVSNYIPQEATGLFLGIIKNVIEPILDILMNKDILDKLKNKYKIDIPTLNLMDQSNKYTLNDLSIDISDISNKAIISSGLIDCDAVLSKVIELIEKKKQEIKNQTKEIDSKLEELNALCNGNDGALDILIKAIKDLIDLFNNPPSLEEIVSYVQDLINLIFKIAQSILKVLLKLFINISDPVYLGYRDTVKWIAIEKINLSFILLSVVSCIQECPYLNKEKQKQWKEMLEDLEEMTTWDQVDFSEIEKLMLELQEKLKGAPCPKLRQLKISNCPLLSFNPQILINGLNRLSGMIDSTINPFLTPINTLMSIKIPSFAGLPELDISQVIPRKYPIITLSSMESEIWKRLSVAAPGWNNDTIYNYGSIVTYKNSTYVLLKINDKGTIPDSDGSIWKRIKIYNGANFGIEPPSGTSLVPDNPASFKTAVDNSIKEISSTIKDPGSIFNS